MESKLNSIIEAFKHLEYEQAARLIDELESKREKAKTKLTEEQEYTVLALKCGALLRLGRYGQASKVIQTANFEKLQSTEIMSILFENVRELQLPTRQAELIAIQEKSKEKPPKDGSQYPLLKLYIVARRFADASKFCLKTYDSTKTDAHFFWQIYLEFLNILNKNDLLLGKRQSLIKTKPGLPLQFIQLFWTKFSTTYNLDTLIDKKNPIVEDVVIFYARLLITQQKQQEAFQILDKYHKQISNPVSVADLYKSAYLLDKNETARGNFLKFYESIFRSNMDIVNYQPLYDLYNDYLDLLIECDLKQAQLAITQVSKESRFDTSKILKDKLSFYLSSLISQYKDVSTMKIQTRLDFFKTSLKTLLLQIISILNKVKPTHTNLNSYLNEFIKHFGKTLTFCEEFIVICPKYFEIKLQQQGYTAQNSLILDINRRKLQYVWGKRPLPKDAQSLHQLFEEYYKLYIQTLANIDKNRVLEKGQRYLADEYIIILSDIFRQYFQSSTQPLTEPIFNLLLLLQHCSKKSDYNYSFKLRLIYFYDRLNLSERVLNIYETLDIKSVQFETLGYLIYNSITSWGQEKEFEELLLRAVKSYQDNGKEIKEYAYKCLERNKLANLEEFLSYDNYVSRSYSKLVLWTVMANKFRGTTNEEYYIKKVLQILNSDTKLVFNSDYKRLQSVVNSSRQYCSFFGPYNSRQLFANDCALKLEQLQLLAGRYDSPPVQLKQVLFSSIFDFSGFEFLRQQYKYVPVKSAEEQSIERTYECLTILHKLQQLTNQIARAIFTKQELAFDKQIQDIHGHIKALDKFKGQTRQLMLIQRKLSLVIKLINDSLSTISGKKKKKDEDKKMGENLRNIRETLYKVICSYEPKGWPAFKIWDKSLQAELKELEVSQDRLEKLASMNPKQYDGLYRIS